MFSAEESSSRIILFAETPVYSVLMFVLELQRARSGCIVQQAASVHRFAPDECGQASRNRNLRHPAVDRFDRTVAKAVGRIRNKVTSAVFRAGSNWGSLRLSHTCLQEPPSPKSDNLINLLLSYFTYFVFHQGGRRLPKKVFKSTLKVFAFLFLLLLAADWCWVSAGRVEEFSDLLGRKTVAKLCRSFL